MSIKNFKDSTLFKINPLVPKTNLAGRFWCPSQGILILVPETSKNFFFFLSLKIKKFFFSSKYDWLGSFIFERRSYIDDPESSKNERWKENAFLHISFTWLHEQKMYNFKNNYFNFIQNIFVCQIPEKSIKLSQVTGN